MKKYLLTVLIIIFAGCYDNYLEIESYADYSSDISYKVGSKRDTRLTFFDINELKQIRSIPNNLTEGDLLGRVQFAQTHTIDPNNNAARNEPSLIPYRNALLLFTPQVELSSLKATVTATYNDVKSTETYTLEPPKNMPKSDKNNSDKKDITYSKRSFSVMLPYNMVCPDMRIDFEGVTKDGALLTGALYNPESITEKQNIEFAAPQEGVFLFLKLGMLVGVPTDPVYQFDMIDDAAHAMAEYFQTVPFSRLVNGKYEDVVLNEVILRDGKIYTGQSDYQNPDAYSGDMREDVAKAQFSVGIDLANKGVASSALDQSHEINHDMFYFTVHHTQGKYAGGKVQGHGLSGGNGIGTLYASRGNEFSHEVGHGYNMGHYPFSDTVSYGSIHGYQTGWGYDAYHNRMRANIAWNSNGGEETFMQYFISPFQSTYNWNKDSMAGGWADSAISRYTHNTAMTTRQIQQNIKGRYFLSDSKLNDVYEYVEWDEANKKIRIAGNWDFLQKRINPTEKGVPVITILGGYDPDNPSQSVLYPRLRGNWGNIFGSLFTANPEGSVYLEITYSDNSKEYVKLNETRFNSGIINKFHVNIPESKKPVQVVLYNKGVQKTININVNDYNTPMPKAVVIGKEKGYEDVIAVDVARLNELLKDKVVASYTLSEKEKYLITTLDFNNSIGMLDANQKAIANDYLNITKSIKLIDDFIEQNYELLESNNQEKDTELKNLLNSKGMGSVSYLFNQAVINGKCIAVNSDKAVTAKTCNELDNQRWVIDGTGRIHSAVYPGYCLELGKMQTLQLCSESLNQRWKVKTDTGKIQYENIGKANNCIDNSASEPEKIIAYQCNNGANQQFKQEISKDDNKYLSVMQGNLIEDIWKYIPATAGVE